jgi:hypothetical protein
MWPSPALPDTAALISQPQLLRVERFLAHTRVRRQIPPISLQRVCKFKTCSAARKSVLALSQAINRKTWIVLLEFVANLQCRCSHLFFGCSGDSEQWIDGAQISFPWIEDSRSAHQDWQSCS